MRNELQKLEAQSEVVFGFAKNFVLNGSKNYSVDVFKNSALDSSVRIIHNKDGSISINAEDVAIGFGWFKLEEKNGKTYQSIRWDRMNGFSTECGFDHLWSKDDYIPEPLFYRLGMKANNEKAEKFQNWLSFEVLPTLRKTGSYSIAPEVPERKLTADDYLRAASIISTCKNERLPYVLDLLKKSGIKIPKLQSEQSKSVAGRDVEGRARKAIGTAKLVYGITYADISRKSGVTRQQIGRIYSGESVPTLERSEVVCDAIHDLIVKTTA